MASTMKVSVDKNSDVFTHKLYSSCIQLCRLGLYSHLIYKCISRIECMTVTLMTVTYWIVGTVDDIQILHSYKVQWNSREALLLTRKVNNYKCRETDINPIIFLENPIIFLENPIIFLENQIIFLDKLFFKLGLTKSISW